MEPHKRFVLLILVNSTNTIVRTVAADQHLHEFSLLEIHQVSCSPTKGSTRRISDELPVNG